MTWDANRSFLSISQRLPVSINEKNSSSSQKTLPSRKQEFWYSPVLPLNKRKNNKKNPNLIEQRPRNTNPPKKRMNPLQLGGNGHLLLPILALFLMNISVAEAKPNWAEGSKGNFAMVILIITSLLVGSGIIGAVVYVYRTLVSHRSVPSDEEISNQIRESKEWLAYTEWIRADEGPTAHRVERAAAARVLDLERQLFGAPPPSSPLFSQLFRAPKNRPLPSVGGDKPVHENSRRDKGKTPLYRHTPHPQIQTADEIRSTTTIKDDGKVVTFDSVRSVKSKGPSSESTAHKAKSATAKDCAKNSIHKSISSAKSTDSSRTSTGHRTNSATIKDNGKKRTHRSRSSNTTADKDNEFSFSKQYVIAPPPNAHTVATSSKHVEIPTKTASASRHGYFAPSPSDEFAPYRYHQPRRARKPIPIIHQDT